MEKYTVYVCESCGYESRSFDDMEEHEASHLGLTVKELHEYNAIKSLVRYANDLIFKKDNDKTRSVFNEATENLLTFEREHGLKA